MDKRYLEQRRAGWYLVVEVPRPLRQHVAKKRIIKSLHTRSLKEAQRLRWEMLTEVRRYFALVEDQVDAGVLVSEPERVIREVTELVQGAALGLRRFDPEAFEEGLDVWIDQKREEAAGQGREVDPALADAYASALKILHGEIGTLAQDALEVHLEDLRARNRRESTIEARRGMVEEFLKWRGKTTELKDITPQDAGRYRTEVLMKSGRALKTIKAHAAHLKAFGGWCVDAGYLDNNPFDRITKRLEDSTRGTSVETKVRPYTEEELVTLLTGIREHRGTEDPLWGLTVLALFTGCRAEEIASLRKEDLHPDDPVPHIHIPEGKTKGSIRDVPLHPKVVPLVETLIKRSSKDSPYLFDTLKPGGQDKKRFHGESKRFATLTNKIGLSDPALRFHSLRHNLTTALRRAGVDSDTAKQITGHSRQGSGSFARYDHGQLLEVLAEAVAKVDFGQEVAQLLSATS